MYSTICDGFWGDPGGLALDVSAQHLFLLFWYPHPDLAWGNLIVIYVIKFYKWYLSYRKLLSSDRNPPIDDLIKSDQKERGKP